MAHTMSAPLTPDREPQPATNQNQRDAIRFLLQIKNDGNRDERARPWTDAEAAEFTALADVRQAELQASPSLTGAEQDELADIVFENE